MTEVTSVLAHSRHLRAANICNKGAKNWWKHHGLNWSDFVSNGIAVETLESTGDKMALDVAKIARDEASGR
jgi:hypothetical protein